ncbi:nmrA family transcriptional regulator [Aspergillus aurantiobrunneus]
MSQNTIIVFGATGIQGGSVAKAILTDPATAHQFHVRAVTRDPSKAAAVGLADLGAEIIQADMEDKDSLRAALQGADAVFLVTNFMETLDHVAETRQGMNVADICKETGVKHLIWSSLPHVEKISNGKYNAAVHFDSKAHVDEHIRSIGVPHTIVHVGTYMKFLVESLEPLSSNPPVYGFTWPQPVTLNTEIPLIDPAADVGKFIKAILLNREEHLGRQLKLAERYYTVREFIEVAKANGVDIKFQALEKESFKARLAAQGLPGFFQEDMAQVIQFAAEYGFWGGKGFEEEHKLVKEPLTSLEESLRSSVIFAGLKG